MPHLCFVFRIKLRNIFLLKKDIQPSYHQSVIKNYVPSSLIIHLWLSGDFFFLIVEEFLLWFLVKQGIRGLFPCLHLWDGKVGENHSSSLFKKANATDNPKSNIIQKLWNISLQEYKHLISCTWPLPYEIGTLVVCISLRRKPRLRTYLVAQ